MSMLLPQRLVSDRHYMVVTVLLEACQTMAVLDRLNLLKLHKPWVVVVLSVVLMMPLPATLHTKDKASNTIMLNKELNLALVTTRSFSVTQKLPTARAHLLGLDLPKVQHFPHPNLNKVVTVATHLISNKDMGFTVIRPVANTED